MLQFRRVFRQCVFSGDLSFLFPDVEVGSQNPGSEDAAWRCRSAHKGLPNRCIPLGQNAVRPLAMAASIRVYRWLWESDEKVVQLSYMNARHARGKGQ